MCTVRHSGYVCKETPVSESQSKRKDWEKESSEGTIVYTVAAISW